MSNSIDEGGFKVRFDFERMGPLAQSVRPGIRVSLRITNMGTGTLLFYDPKIRVFMRGGFGERVLGEGITLDSFGELPQSASAHWTFNVYLNYMALKEIEELREAKDLLLEFKGSFIGELVSKRFNKQLLRFSSIRTQIARSDWIDNFLRRLKFKDVKLIEFPKINGFPSIIDHLDAAWKHYSMGDYDSTLVLCRKSLEALSNEVKNKGLKRKTTNNEGKKITIPDWRKVIGNNDVGDIIGETFQKTMGFVASGAHHGKAINREDADYALMTTYALADISIKKLSKLENT